MTPARASVPASEPPWPQPYGPRLPTALLLVLVGAVASCRSPNPTAPASFGAVRPGVEIVTGGAGPNDRLPLLVALHGLGDRPENFVRVVEGLPIAARVIVPTYKPLPNGGYAWFASRVGDGIPDALGREIGRVADELAAYVRHVAKERPTVGRPVVTGFSQGGMLAFGLAVRHPTRFSTAVPISGWLPPSALPSVEAAPGTSAKIIAFHGTEDRVVPYAPTTELMGALQRRGRDAQLRARPGIGHTIDPALHRDLLTVLSAALAATKN